MHGFYLAFGKSTRKVALSGIRTRVFGFPDLGSKNKGDTGSTGKTGSDTTKCQRQSAGCRSGHTKRSHLEISTVRRRQDTR